MNTLNYIREIPADNGMKGAVESLASYICAADRPRAALLSVYKSLLCEVEQTNRAARAHFGSLGHGR